MILNCTSSLQDFSTYNIIINSETDLISNTYILKLLNSTGVEEIINRTNFVTELINTYLENIQTNFLNSTSIEEIIDTTNFVTELIHTYLEKINTNFFNSTNIEEITNTTYFIEVIKNTYLGNKNTNFLNSTNIEEITNTTNFVNTYLGNIYIISSLIIDSTYYLKNSEFNLIVNSNSIKILNNYTLIKDKNELIKKIREDLLNGNFNININGEFYYIFKEDNMIMS